jgi:serine/threonine protein kinase/Tfp pilus assembly protein PilF
MKCLKCHSENPDTSRFCSECGTQLLLGEEIPSPTKTLETPKEEFTRGTTIANRYEFIEELGKGGMGKVYKVFDKKIKEEVALKLLKSEIAADEKTIQRFSNELKLARKIVHKNVGRMYDINEEKDTHYITMEYVPGEDLKSFIRRARQLTVGAAVSIAKQVCDGLAEAHKLGVVHRDLKPQNIMIDKEGNARIMDFGIARSLKTKGITGEGVIIGTPEYMSPEQVEGKEVDQRSDIYSLGIILYEMVTGQVPFEGDTPLSVAMKHKTKAPPNPRKVNVQIPEDLSRLILRCMEKAKEKRYQTAEEVLSELGKIGEPGAEIISAPKWENSIAVLPFTNMSADPEQEYFCDGIAEEIINALAHVESLRVIARTSAFAFKGKHEDIREIGKKLDVDTLLEGSVRKAGTRIRITAQLVNVADGSHLWSERYDREMKDVFAIQDEISLAIVDNLKVKLLKKEKARLVKRHTEDTEAYELYLKGSYFISKYAVGEVQKGLAYFQKAIAKDPNFALALGGIGTAYLSFGTLSLLPPDEAFPKAKDYLTKALAIDDTLAESHAALGTIAFYYDWDWPEVEKRIEKALALNPGGGQAHAWYSWYLVAVGRYAQAIAAVKKAQELDPLLPLYYAFGIAIHSYQGKFEEAEEQFHKAIELDPNLGIAYFHMAHSYLFQDRYEEGISASQKAIELTTGLGWAECILGGIYCLQGERDKANQILNQILSQKKKQYVSSFILAYFYYYMGEKDKSFEWLDKAYEERDILMILLNVPKFFSDLRDDPRFEALLKRLGFR